MLTLVSETAELALDLLEKRDLLIPFCKLRTKGGESVIICSDSVKGFTLDDAAQSAREELRRRVRNGDIAEFAFCADKQVKYQSDHHPHRVLQIEFQNGTNESGIYHFPLTVEQGKTSLDPNYALADPQEKLI
jgi:hypothetical protein